MTDCYKGMPTRVRIGCFVIDVIVGSYEDHEQEGTYGHLNMFQKRISVRPGMASHQLANTFIHEVMHGIHSVYGLMRGPDETQPTEEEYTTLTANGLCAFWQDNPKAAAWWSKLLKLEEPA